MEHYLVINADGYACNTILWDGVAEYGLPFGYSLMLESEAPETLQWVPESVAAE